MDTLLDKIESLCRENCVTMHIWHQGQTIQMHELKSLVNTPTTFSINIFLPSTIGSEWDNNIQIMNHIWTISIVMLLDPRFQAEFEHEFFQRLIYKTFRK
jgi:hypothetical protein